MTYDDVMKNARLVLDKCHACPVCNGKVCSNNILGPGAKGLGDTAVRNYEAWRKIYLNIDTICENKPVDASVELFGRSFKYPFFAGPISGVYSLCGEKYKDITYNGILISACCKNGIAAFTGDDTGFHIMQGATKAIAAAGGIGIPTVKPWNKETIAERMDMVTKSGAFAVAMDIDAAGLPFLKNMTPPAGSKTVQELKEIISLTKTPFIIKGIMSVKGALKAKEAGAAAIVVSNHGGRVLDGSTATADVLEEIVQAVDGSMKVFADGGIRTGGDILKAIALGADGVLIARPFVTAVYGGGEEGVKLLIEKLGAELKDAMAMCGAGSIKEITRDMVRR